MDFQPALLTDIMNSTQLTIPADIWSSVGLLLDAVGIVFLFLFAPEKYPDPQSLAFFALEGEDARARDLWRKRQSIRRRVAWTSVFVIVLGFAFQIVAVVFY